MDNNKTAMFEIIPLEGGEGYRPCQQPNLNKFYSAWKLLLIDSEEL